MVLEMHRVVLLDHFHTRAAVLRDLINVRTFQQAERDVAVAQRVERASVALAVKFEI